MFYFNARFRFKIPAINPPVQGSIIAASAISAVDLTKRKFTKHRHFDRRLLDPQLYMASLDPALDSATVAKLAAYPWFHGRDVPKYDSGQHVNRTSWKKQHKTQLVSKWTRSVPTDIQEIRKAARAAVEFQVKMGCGGIFLAGPLTTMADQSLENEVAWLDSGLEACRELNVKQPVYATIAVSEDVLQVPALRNPVIHSLSTQVASRSDLAGAYVVLEQFDGSSYFWTAKDALLSLLVLVDDLHRGAKKRAIVNYIGTFGLIAKAAGAEIWSSGYYLSQRRFSRKGMVGRARPRYHSMLLAGDVGLNEDLANIRDAGLAGKVLTPSAADGVLRSALAKGKKPNDVPEWAYTQNNCAAAQEHYLEVVSAAATALEGMSPSERRRWVREWLTNAVSTVDLLKQQSLVSLSTDTAHQRVWLDVFEEWSAYAKQ